MQTIEKKSKTANAGDIVALVGLKDVTTGETLCDLINQLY